MAKALCNIHETDRVNLLDICPVVAGAVVSKPLLQDASVKAIVFAMDEGQSLSDHRAPFAAQVQMLEGELKFEVEGKVHELVPHDWLTMPPDVTHALTAIKPTRFLLTLIKESPA